MMNFDEYKKAVNRSGMTGKELDDVLDNLEEDVLLNLLSIYELAAGSIGIDPRQMHIAREIRYRVRLYD